MYGSKVAKQIWSGSRTRGLTIIYRLMIPFTFWGFENLFKLWTSITYAVPGIKPRVSLMKLVFRSGSWSARQIILAMRIDVQKLGDADHYRPDGQRCLSLPGPWATP